MLGEECVERGDGMEGVRERGGEKRKRGGGGGTGGDVHPPKGRGGVLRGGVEVTLGA